MDKDFLLNQSKTFCMAPWVHLNTTPVGEALSCCIARVPMGNTVYSSVVEVLNSEGMKNLRQDMLNERFNANCETCFDHERQGIYSFRQQFNQRYGKHIEESLNNTREDGSLADFKMRYFDVRFSNICNFKCRSCNSHFSSQWEQENIKRNLPYGRIPIKNNFPQLLEEIIEHIPHMEFAYFAGGEPLITEEHYILLEEMIRQGRTDIKLLYNSNVSNLKYKNKDIMEIWSKFDQPVDMSASIDHIGAKAEYIRHGTDWDTVAQNLITLKNAKNVKLLVNSVMCLFNYVTIDEMYNYFIDTGIYTPGESFNLYPLSSPEYMSARVLSRDLKAVGKLRLHGLMNKMRTLGFSDRQIDNIKNIITWTEAEDQWETLRDKFKAEVTEIDKVRGECFSETFPELSCLFDKEHAA